MVIPWTRRDFIRAAVQIGGVVDKRSFNFPRREYQPEPVRFSRSRFCNSGIIRSHLLTSNSRHPILTVTDGLRLLSVAACPTRNASAGMAGAGRAIPPPNTSGGMPG
jgi:hypothetical protein